MDEILKRYISAARNIAKRCSGNNAKLLQSITALYHAGLREVNRDVRDRRTKQTRSRVLLTAILDTVFPEAAAAQADDYADTPMLASI